MRYIVAALLLIPVNASAFDASISSSFGYVYSYFQGIEVGFPVSLNSQRFGLDLSPAAGVFYSEGLTTYVDYSSDCNGTAVPMANPDGSVYFACYTHIMFAYRPLIDAKYRISNNVSLGVGARGGYGAGPFGLFEVRLDDYAAIDIKAGEHYQAMSVQYFFSDW